MQRSVWVVWFHKASSDEKPMHHAGPIGIKIHVARTKKSIELNKDWYKHKINISMAITGHKSSFSRFMEHQMTGMVYWKVYTKWKWIIQKFGNYVQKEEFMWK